jgi:hypothetical protein
MAASHIAALAGACTLALATAAQAAQPARSPISVSESFDVPAGELCDFRYLLTATATGTKTVFGNRVEQHVVELVTHTNADTGFTLTERDQLNLTIYPDGSSKQVGVEWHLRDPSGKLVLVQAGQLVFGPTGDLVKATPHVDADFASVACPALGGEPA